MSEFSYSPKGKGVERTRVQTKKENTQSNKDGDVGEKGGFSVKVLLLSNYLLLLYILFTKGDIDLPFKCPHVELQTKQVRHVPSGIIKQELQESNQRDSFYA